MPDGVRRQFAHDQNGVIDRGMAFRQGSHEVTGLGHLPGQTRENTAPLGTHEHSSASSRGLDIPKAEHSYALAQARRLEELFLYE